jgi:hypothetical protein
VAELPHFPNALVFSPAQPFSQWTPVATNVLEANGNFTIIATNAVIPNASQQFYLLQLQ